MDINRELILKSFLQESEEGFAQMEQSILELESHSADGELLQTIFRVVHTMKGNAGILQLENLLFFTHKLEDLLDTIRSGQLSVTSDITTLLLASLDILREMVAAAGEGNDETSASAKEVLSKISRSLKGTDEAVQAGVTQEKPVPETALGLAGMAHKEAERTLRVDVQKLDRLLNLSGEITIARGRLAQVLERGEETSINRIREAHNLADALHLELQETILKTRMVPVGPLLHHYTRTVRDLAKSHGKLAQLHLQGEDVEVDTSVVEHLKDPLLHMIRNAVDHGIEAPAERKSRGKPPTGSITVRAAHEGGNVVIEVSDDGAGLDRGKIVEAARRRGIAGDLDKLSQHDVFQLIFESGFTTAAEVTDLSGRGVGMDVVRKNVQALRGSVHIDSQPGAGSTVHIRLPLTLAIIEGFSVGVGDETYVIPVDQVIECVELRAEDIDLSRGEGVLQLRDEPLPFLYLEHYFGFAARRTGRQNIVVVQHEGGRAGLAVDQLYGATPTVIKPLPPLFKGVPGVSGSAILGSGRVALILDVPALLRTFCRDMAGAAAG